MNARTIKTRRSTVYTKFIAMVIQAFLFRAQQYNFIRDGNTSFLISSSTIQLY